MKKNVHSIKAVNQKQRIYERKIAISHNSLKALKLKKINRRKIPNDSQ